MSLSPDTRPRFPRPPVTPTERRWVLIFAVLVMLFTSIPYLLAYQRQGAEMVFSGFVFGVEDGHSYIAKMLSGAAGHWLFYSPYTAYPQNGLLMFLPYLLLGKLAAPPGLHEQLVALYHLYRFAAGLLVSLATYDFLAYWIASVRARRLGLALISLGGGLGWLLVLLDRQVWLGSLPLEFYSPEAFGFLSLYGLPHLAAARALMLWAILAYLHADRQGFPLAPRSILLLSGPWLLSGLFQPMVALLLGVLFAWHRLVMLGPVIWTSLSPARPAPKGWAGLRSSLSPPVRFLLLAGLLPGVLVLYNAWVAWRDPFAAAWTAQNLLFSPNFVHYLLAYSLILPYAWLGGRRLVGVGRQAWFLTGWVCLLPALAYAPLNMQRRLVEGEWVALVTLAMAALEGAALARRQSGKAPRFPIQAPLWLLFPSTLILWLGGLLAVLDPSLPLFRPAGEARAFEALAVERIAPEETERPSLRGGQIVWPVAKDAVVLAAYDTGTALPAWAPVRVLIGHGPESIHLDELRLQVQAFYTSDTPDAQRLDLIRQFGIEYVFWGPAERLLGDWSPDEASWLAQTYQEGDYAIYRVNLPP